MLADEPPEPLSDSGNPIPESGSEINEKSVGGLCHTQYWLRRSKGWPPLSEDLSPSKVLSEGLDPASETGGISLEFLLNGGGTNGGGSRRWLAASSDSHSGITRNAGKEGGMLEEGEVSRDRELSSQESESEALVV